MTVPALVLPILSSFRVIVDTLDGPREVVDDQGDEVLQGGPLAGALPAPPMVGNVEEPQVDGVAGEAEMLHGVVGRTGLDDDSGPYLRART
jgi:hypothetical protein